MVLSKCFILTKSNIVMIKQVLKVKTVSTLQHISVTLFGQTKKSLKMIHLNSLQFGSWSFCSTFWWEYFFLCLLLLVLSNTMLIMLEATSIMSMRIMTMMMWNQSRLELSMSTIILLLLMMMITQIMDPMLPTLLKLNQREELNQELEHLVKSLSLEHLTDLLNNLAFSNTSFHSSSSILYSTQLSPNTKESIDSQEDLFTILGFQRCFWLLFAGWMEFNGSIQDGDPQSSVYSLTLPLEEFGTL